MTVNVARPSKLDGLGNGASTSFGFSPMEIYEDTDMVVTLVVIATGAETSISLGTGPSNFSLTMVAGFPGTGSVIYPADEVTPMASTHKIIMKPTLPQEQETNLNNQGGYHPEVQEVQFDKFTLLIKGLQEEIDRSVKVSIGSPIDPDAFLGSLTAAEANAVAAAAAAATSETNAGTSETAAGAAQTSAETAQTAAELAETNAETAQTAAELAETNAATSAAKLQGTSTSSLLIAVASKEFATQAGKFFTAGTWLNITSDADPSNYMHGQVTAYDGVTLTVNVTNIGGSGTLADWTITVAGTQGATGTAGADGADGTDAGFDVPFIAGYSSLMGADDLTVRVFGDIVITRAFSIVDEEGYIRTVATGAAVIVDIEKNGVSVYSAKPQFAISASAITNGTLKTDGTEDFAIGDRMTFKVTQIGSTIAGARVMFSAKGTLI